MRNKGFDDITHLTDDKLKKELAFAALTYDHRDTDSIRWFMYVNAEIQRRGLA